MSTNSPQLFTAGGNGAHVSSPGQQSSTPHRHKAQLIHRSPESFSTQAPSTDQLIQQHKQLVINAKSNWDIWCTHTNKNTITTDDLQQILHQSNFSAADIQSIIRTIDPSNTTNSIDYDTFINATVKKLSLTLQHLAHPQDLLSEFEEALRSSKRDTRFVNQLNNTTKSQFTLNEKQ